MKLDTYMMLDHDKHHYKHKLLLSVCLLCASSGFPLWFVARSEDAETWIVTSSELIAEAKEIYSKKVPSILYCSRSCLCCSGRRSKLQL